MILEQAVNIDPNQINILNWRNFASLKMNPPHPLSIYAMRILKEGVVWKKDWLKLGKEREYLFRLMEYKIRMEKLMKGNRTMDDKVQLFEEQQIRTAWDEEKEEWYFSVVDVIGV